MDVPNVQRDVAFQVQTGPKPQRNPSAVWALSTATIDAIDRGPLGMVTGAPAAPKPTNRSTAHPGVEASKKKMVAVAVFETAHLPNSTKNREIDPGHAQDLDRCTAVAVPRVAF